VPVAYGTDSGTAPYDLYFSSGKIIAQFNVGGSALTVSSPSALAANTSYHVVATYDGTTGRLYLNGNLVASAAKSGTLSGYISGYGLAIGDDAGFSDPAFKGTIDEVAVYAGKALSATQVLNHYNAGTSSSTPAPTPSPTITPVPTPTPTAAGYPAVILGDGPSAYYRLDDTGSTANDSSGNNVSGSVGGSVTEGVHGLILGSDTAMTLPGRGGTAGTITVAPSSLLQPASAVSVEAWIRPSTAPSAHAVALAYGSDAHVAPYEIYFNNGKIVAQFGLTTGTLMVSTASSVNVGDVYHIVSTYDGSTGRLYVNGMLRASAAKAGTLTGYTPGYGLQIGDDAGFTDPAYAGTIDEVAIYAGKALSAAQVQNHYTAGVTAPPSPAPAYTDYSTYGDTLSGSQYNPNETTISSSNAGSLHKIWAVDLGSAVTAQPVVATNVSINGTPTTVLYVGTEGGVFYALNANTGATIWKDSLGSFTSSCTDLPGGVFGITGTATFVKSSNTVYVADGKDQVHALNMQTGAEMNGWPVTVATTPSTDHIYSALVYNPANRLLYASTASLCDKGVWNGRSVAINTATAAITSSFFPASAPPYQNNGYYGDGIWGIGGPAIDAANNVYVATGNTVGGGSDSAAYGEQLIQLDGSLNFIAANQPGVTGGDVDFGATPMLFQPPGCSPLITAKNKTGFFIEWYVSAISSGPIQRLSMEASTSSGEFVGATAYSPVTNLVYVGDPGGNSTFTNGIVALAPQGDCTLALAWQQTAYRAVNGNDTNNSVTVANGVVYLADGLGDEVFAYNAANGTPLWNSGTTISRPVMVSPTVDGRLFVSSWDHHLYSFGL
jgi:outer membrane protein assembly factor BamB